MNKIIFWTMAAMAFLLASCAGEEEVTTPADSLKGKPINVDVLVSDIKTRAGYDNTSLPKMFYLSIDQNDPKYDYTNVVMKYEGDTWVAYESDAENAEKKQLLWDGSEGNVTVTAATFSLSSASTTLNALTDQSTADGIKASDHLYYYSNAVKPSENGTISIPFDHIMSKLEITVTLRNQYGTPETNPITSAIALGSATSATYSHAEETPWSNPSAVSDISLCSSGSYSATGRTATYEAILIPQNIAENTFGVKVTIGNKSYTWRSASAITFEGGKKYTLNLTLGKNELTLNTISVSNWNEEKVAGLNAELVIPYVTFTAKSEQTFKFYIPDKFASALGANEYFEYSVGDGKWTPFTTTVDNIPFGGSHGNLRLRGKSSKGTALNQNNAYSTIEFTTPNSPVDCTGDIRTLIDYENYADVSTADAKFCYLFYQNTQLRTAPALPAKTLASSCYREMFSGCTALTTAPELPAKTLAGSCYYEMFGDCTALTTAPALPAETLAFSCYQGMFSGCTALTTAPKLPATTLADGCYQGMFLNCSALTTAPKLPAKSLAESCYCQMFSCCSALKTAPELSAKTLAGSCYYEMFGGCTALTAAPALPATTLADFCYRQMFSGCSALKTAPELRATTLADGCYQGMFYNCTKLSSVTLSISDPQIAESFTPLSYLLEWLNGAGKDAHSPKLYLGGSIAGYYNSHSGELTNDSFFPKNWSVQILQ